MKSMNNDNNSSNDNNWLGFSLSPHMKMKFTSPDSQQHHQYTHQSQAPSSTTKTVAAPGFYISSSHLNNPAAICYGSGENGGFHSSMSILPLKSDGSLCITEALRRSQQEGMVMPNTSPKLEDFLGGATMAAAHQYGSQEREAMALSLDSMYYHQNGEAETSRQLSLDLLQEPFSQQGEEIQIQHDSFYPGMPCCGLYQIPLQEQVKEGHLPECDSQILSMTGDELNCQKNWVSVHYSNYHGLDHHHQQQNIHSSMVEDGASGSMGCGDFQSLSLSMSPGSQSSCVTASRQISPTGAECMALETKKRGCDKVVPKQPVHRKSLDSFGQRTSQFRGVTRHRWTGRYEAHLWDNSCKKEGQTRKGRQVYLGGYDMEQKAARAYDLAALKYWGPSTHINFPLENYIQELEEMKNMNRQEYVAHLRRKSSGFSRGASMYRGVTRHHQHGRWQARIGRVAGNKDLYLGTFGTQEEAAEAYDIAAIKFRGVNAVTNFEISRYDVERILASSTLPAGGVARRNKDRESNPNPAEAIEFNPSVPQNDEEPVQTESNVNGLDWNMVLCQSPHKLQQNACVVQDLTRIDSVLSTQAIMDESTKLGVTHCSNPSSLVTSLSSSREASPDKRGASMLFAKPTMAAKFISPRTSVNSWIPPPHLRTTPPTMGHLPVFTAWNDTNP